MHTACECEERAQEQQQQVRSLHHDWLTWELRVTMTAVQQLSTVVDNPRAKADPMLASSLTCFSHARGERKDATSIFQYSRKSKKKVKKYFSSGNKSLWIAARKSAMHWGNATNNTHAVLLPPYTASHPLPRPSDTHLIDPLQASVSESAA